MAKPKLLGVTYAARAATVKASWESPAGRISETELRAQAARLKSLKTFEFRARANPLTAGDPVARDRWPRSLERDYGPGVPHLFRFEMADRWRGYYALVGEAGGARVWVLYLWSHEEYSRQSGYEKK